MQQVTEVITDMIKQYDKGANEYLTSGNRDIILEQLKALQEEVYATGDADYAGRYVFTGYRTETSLMFAENTKKPYQITEQFTVSDLRTNTFVDTSFQDAGGNWQDLVNLKEGTQSDYTDVKEQSIEKGEYHRIRLSYKECEENVLPVIEYDFKEGATPDDPPVAQSTIIVTQEAKSTDVPSPYMMIGQSANKNEVIYLSDTGELLLGEDVYKKLSGLVDNPLTSGANEGEFRVTYQKSEFKDGDLRPEHYFYCIAAGDDGTLSSTPTVPDAANDLVYNPDYLKHGKDRQVIEYDVGFNQRLQVNTIAEECFNPSVTREVDDMVQALEKMKKVEDVVTALKGMLDKETDPAKQKELKDQLDAANKALTYERQVVQTKFKGGITVMQGFLDEVNVAVTSCGARSSRLELVSSRLSSTKATFDTLKSENEDVDLSEAVVQLTSAEMTYEAALKATGKIMQVNLMDFV